MLKVLRDRIEGPDRIRIRTLLQIGCDVMNFLADVDPGTIPVFLLRWRGMRIPPLTATLHPGQGGTTAKLQSLERGRGRTAPSVTDAVHGSGQATVRVTEHAIALWTTTAPTCRQITASSKLPRQAPFYVPDRADAARGWGYQGRSKSKSPAWSWWTYDHRNVPSRQSGRKSEDP